MSAQVTAATAEEFEVHRWLAEASELRLVPGRWPRLLTTDLGNKQPFVLAGVDEESALYLPGNGYLALRVWND